LTTGPPGLASIAIFAASSLSQLATGKPTAPHDENSTSSAVDPTQAKTGLELGTQPSLGKKKQQVTPLRCASVGMTILFGCWGVGVLGFGNAVGMLVSKQNCHPDRSAAQWRDLLCTLYWQPISLQT
jgi:hypothetical protein